MCNIGYAIETRAREEGIKAGERKGKREGEKAGKIKAQLDNIRSLMETMNLSVTGAMDALKIPEKDRKVLLKELDSTV